MATFNKLPTELHLKIFGDYFASYGGYFKAPTTPPKAKPRLPVLKLPTTIGFDYKAFDSDSDDSEDDMPATPDSLKSDDMLVYKSSPATRHDRGPSAALVLNKHYYEIALEVSMKQRTTLFTDPVYYKTFMCKQAEPNELLGNQNTTSWIRSIALDLHFLEFPWLYYHSMVQTNFSFSSITRMELVMKYQPFGLVPGKSQVRNILQSMKGLKDILPAGLTEYIVRWPGLDPKVETCLKLLVCPCARDKNFLVHHGAESQDLSMLPENFLKVSRDRQMELVKRCWAYPIEEGLKDTEDEAGKRLDKFLTSEEVGQWAALRKLNEDLGKIVRGELNIERAIALS